MRMCASLRTSRRILLTVRVGCGTGRESADRHAQTTRRGGTLETDTVKETPKTCQKRENKNATSTRRRLPLHLLLPLPILSLALSVRYGLEIAVLHSLSRPLFSAASSARFRPHNPVLQTTRHPLPCYRVRALAKRLRTRTRARVHARCEAEADVQAGRKRRLTGREGRVQRLDTQGDGVTM